MLASYLFCSHTTHYSMWQTNPTIRLPHRTTPHWTIPVWLSRSADQDSDSEGYLSWSSLQLKCGLVHSSVCFWLCRFCSSSCCACRPIFLIWVLMTTDDHRSIFRHTADCPVGGRGCRTVGKALWVLESCTMDLQSPWHINIISITAIVVFPTTEVFGMNYHRVQHPGCKPLKESPRMHRKESKSTEMSIHLQNLRSLEPPVPAAVPKCPKSNGSSSLPHWLRWCNRSGARQRWLETC